MKRTILAFAICALLGAFVVTAQPAQATTSIPASARIEWKSGPVELRKADNSGRAGSVVIDFGNPVTITPTAEQEARLLRMVGRANAQKPEGSPDLTTEQYLRKVLMDAIEQQLHEAAYHEQESACEAFGKLGAQAKAQIVAALGGNKPCK